MTRRVAVLAAIVGSAALAGLAFPARVDAADPPGQLQMAAEPREDGTWMLAAGLTSDGAPQSQVEVQFFEQVNFFGDRWVPLGTAVTDAAGVASWLYSPTSDGDQVLVARSMAEGGRVESDPVTITVSGAVPFHPPEEPLLPVVRALAFPVGLVILVLVWLTLAGIFLRAVIGIARSAAADGGSPVPLRGGPSDHQTPQPRNTE